MKAKMRQDVTMVVGAHVLMGAQAVVPVPVQGDVKALVINHVAVLVQEVAGVQAIKA